MTFGTLLAFLLLFAPSADAAKPSKEERARAQSVTAMEQMRGSMEHGSRAWADITRRLGDYSHAQAETVAREGGADTPWRERAVAAWTEWLAEASDTDSDVPGVLLSLGDEQAKLGDVEGARRAYARLLAEWEESPEASAAVERVRSLGSGTAESKPAAPDPAAGASFKEAVRAAIADATPTVEACYEAALRELPDLRGKVIVSFSIDPAGKVQEARIKESSLSNAAVEACVVGQVQALAFPATGATEPVKVAYPFVFEPVSARAP